MSERREFVRLATGGEVPLRELCRRFGISAPTGYKWLRRWDAEGEAGLEDQSRRPQRSPTQTSAHLEEQVVALRRRHPRWGGRKISAALRRQGIRAPAPSTVTGILRRRGLLGEDSPPRAYLRFEHPSPNDLWQMDFKGHFALEVGGRCHPFSVLDDHSRYNLSLAACFNQTTGTVRALLEAAFRHYGLPRAILCDNGSPWGNDLHQPWTPLGVWLLDLGVRVVHSRPFHPQTAGKQERFHATLGFEVLEGRPWEDLASVQGAFDRWRPVYNFERPHDSLGMAVPADRYRPSPRPFPEVVPEVVYPEGFSVRKADEGGRISFRARRFRVGKAFSERWVGVTPTTSDGLFQVYYRHQVIQEIRLGQLEEV